MLELSMGPLVMSLLGGMVIGAAAGLLPGVHVNNTSALLLGLSPALSSLGMGPPYVATMIVASTISQSFLDVVPSIFLGAPDDATVLAVMPGHKMLMEGRGVEAVRLSAMGSGLAIVASLLLIVPLCTFFRLAYPLLGGYMAPVLIAISAFIVLTNNGGPGGRVRKIGGALVVFIASAALGLVSFSLEPALAPIVAIPAPSVLLPLLSGLFGAPTLLISLLTEPAIPRQAHNDITLSRGEIAEAAALGTMAGALVSWFPAVSSGVATSIASIFSRRDDSSDKRYLLSVSGVNTANAIFSLVALYVIMRPRSGAVAAAQELLGGTISQDVFVLLLAVICAAGTVSYLLTLAIGGPAARIFSAFDYHLLNKSVLLFLAAVTLLMAGLPGLAIFLAAMAIGTAAHLISVRKTCLMGALLFPCILYFL